MMSFVKIRKYIAWGLSIFVIVALIVYSQTVLKTQICSGVEIISSNGNAYPFLKASEIEKLATKTTNLTLQGTKLNLIDLDQIEKNVRSHSAIQSTEANITRGKKVQISVTFKKPIARLMYGYNIPSKYIDTEGRLFAVSQNFTAKVPILSGRFIDQSCQKTLPKTMIKLLKRIESEQFWKSQLTTIYVDDTTEIEMVPLIGNHLINFGTPHQIENKLAKLKLFYQNIYGSPETAHYTNVSVAFDGQIVCK